MMRDLRFAAVVAAAALTSLCGCATMGFAEPKIEETMFAESLGVDLAQSTKLENGEYIRDLVDGGGDGIKVGQVLSVRYTGWLVDGKQFDSNEGVGGKPFSFRYGNGEVIKGWDQGLDGMRGGGTRQLIIPPSLGYGFRGAGSVIPSNAILVFNVTLP